MKRLLFAIAISLLLAGCDLPDNDNAAKIERSFRCMWTGDCG